MTLRQSILLCSVSVPLALCALFVSRGTAEQAAVTQAQANPWMDSALPPDQRADLLQAQMTEDEQLQLVKGYYGANTSSPITKAAPENLRPILPKTSGFVPGIPRLGIPSLIETDAGVGIANHRGFRPGDQATALPSGIATAATWNPHMAYAAGSIIGTEARDHAFNVVLDGALNLARDPRGGRTFEYAGEDPLLAGTIAGSQVRGIQSQHVISTVKHFAFNDQETGRFVFSAETGTIKGGCSRIGARCIAPFHLPTQASIRNRRRDSTRRSSSARHSSRRFPTGRSLVSACMTWCIEFCAPCLPKAFSIIP